MATRQPFSGILRLSPGEPLSTENFSFQDVDRGIIDQLLQLGARDHKHDAHAALDHYVVPINPIVVVEDTGGTIASDLDIYVGYTLVDSQGGETELNANVQLVQTQAGLGDPNDAPSLALDHVSGDLLANTYYYGVTVADGTGGESGLSPTSVIVVPPGFATSRITVSNLDTIVTEQGGASWRLWRMVSGGAWALISTGVTASVVDDGLMCTDCGVQPPQLGGTGGTNSTSRIKVTVPALDQPVAAVQFRVYASVDGSFGSPAVLGTYPVADFDDEKIYTSLTFTVGAPPIISTAYAGANKIDPDTDLLNFPWKRPVATAGALSLIGNVDGDARIVLDDHSLWIWNSTTGAWVQLSGGGGGGGAGPLAVDEFYAWTAGSAQIGGLTVREIDEVFDGRNYYFDHSTAVTDDSVPGRGWGGTLLVNDAPNGYAVATTAAPTGDAGEYLDITGAGGTPISFPTEYRLGDGTGEIDFAPQTTDWDYYGVMYGTLTNGVYMVVDRVAAKFRVYENATGIAGRANWTLLDEADITVPTLTVQESWISFTKVGRQFVATHLQWDPGPGDVSDVLTVMCSQALFNFWGQNRQRVGYVLKFSATDAFRITYTYFEDYPAYRKLVASVSHVYDPPKEVTVSDGFGRLQFEMGQGNSYFTAKYDTQSNLRWERSPDGYIRVHGQLVALSGAPVLDEIITSYMDDYPNYPDLERRELFQPTDNGSTYPVWTANSNTLAAQVGAISINGSGVIRWQAGVAVGDGFDRIYVDVRFKGYLNYE